MINPLFDFTTPELEDVTVTRGDWTGSWPQTCGVTDSTNIAITIDGERTTVAESQSAAVVIDEEAFTFHAFRANTESFPHCEDGVNAFSWALLRDPT